MSERDRDAFDAEDLLARARRGVLSRAEEQDLARALEERPELATAFRVGMELDRASAVQGGDDALIARAADAALARVADMTSRTRGGRGPLTAGARSGRNRRALVAAAAVMSVIFASGIAAALVSGAVAWPFKSSAGSPGVERAAPDRALGSTTKHAAAPEPLAAPEPEVVTEPSMAREPEPEPARARKASGAPARASAAALFSDANGARRSGDLTAARRLYAALIDAHPSSEEAGVARVSLGKLLLAAGQAQAAEREFRRYLGSGHTQLTEEALVGQAQSLGRLNRVSEERQAWQRLLTQHPSTVYAAQAKQRLAALEDQR